MRMSKNVAETMYELRSLNYEKSVKPTTRKINEILQQRVEMLIERYSKLYIDYGNSNENLTLKPCFITMNQKFTDRKSSEIEEIYKDIVKRGIRANLEREYDDVLNGETNNVTERRARFE